MEHLPTTAIVAGIILAFLAFLILLAALSDAAVDRLERWWERQPFSPGTEDAIERTMTMMEDGR